MDFLKTLTIGVRRRRVDSHAALVVALAEGAAFLAQGASYSYIRARSGTMGPRLMQDAGFGAGMERCKWEAFAAMLGDLTLIVETEMRPHWRFGADVWLGLYRDALGVHPLPEHRSAAGWDDRIAEFEARLDMHLASPPREISEVCRFGARVLLDFAPVDDTIRALDREMVTNNVAFRFIDQVDALRRRADWAALADELGAAR